MKKSTIRYIERFEITQTPNELVFKVTGNGFLHHMVRNLVGTLIEIGLGKPYDIDEVFAAKNRSAAGPTAPASGLYFVRADYDANAD